jgi:SAM-dependent methyltransferase
VVAHDPDPAGELWRDHVSGPNPAAETLADLTIRQPVGSALDVGTGSGLLALLAARHADRVVATDINPHALDLAELNGALNDVRQLEPRLGDLFEPVADSRFDLIVSNPPYVISPETDLLFRHSPMARDALSGTVVREAAAHLTEGGFAHILCNWVQRPGDPSSAAVGSWVEGLGCDALILVHGVEDPLAYAVRWNQRAQQVLPYSYAARLDDWLGYFERLGIEAIGSGAAILRRREGSNWVHEMELASESRGPGGPQLLSVFDGRDYLARTSDERTMRDDSFRIPAPHRLDQSLVSRDDGYVIEAASLVLEEGLGNRLAVVPDLIPVLLRLDGSQTLGAIVDEVAEGTSADPAELLGRASGFVRELLEGGFVTVA